MEGTLEIGHNINVYFRADLRPWVAHRPAIMFWIANTQARGVFQPLDVEGRWLCQISFDPARDPAEAWTPERCIQWIRTAVRWHRNGQCGPVSDAGTHNGRSVGQPAAIRG